MQWQHLADAAASPVFMRKTDKPDAIEQLTGAIARSPSSPASRSANRSSSRPTARATWPPCSDKGMRAISTEISPETGAGGFILPNDRVDVILSRRDREAEKAGATETHQRNHPHQYPHSRDRPDAGREGRPEGRDRQDRDARTDAAPGRDARASRQLGTLSLALRSLADAGETTLPDDERAGRRPVSTRCASASAPCRRRNELSGGRVT